MERKLMSGSQNISLFCVFLCEQLLGISSEKCVRTTKHYIIGLHLKNIYTEGELHEISTAEDFSIVQQKSSREVCRMVRHYNLDTIIAIDYRVNSKRATAFRQWATTVLQDFALRDYVIDKKRMENGAFLNDDYFDNTVKMIESQ